MNVGWVTRTEATVTLYRSGSRVAGYPVPPGRRELAERTRLLTRGYGGIHRKHWRIRQKHLTGQR